MLKTLPIKQRHGLWQKIAAKLFLPVFILGLVISSLVLVVPSDSVQAATSSTLNFQGRLLSDTGGLVPDGSYNIQFNLYTADTGGVSQWTEDRLVSATQGVTVSNGYFSVYLGDVTAFPATIDWDQEQWLGMTVRGTGSCAFAACTPTDAEMTPRFKLTAVPYAFRAGAVVDSAGNAFTGDDLAQIAPTTIQPVTSAVAALRINQAGAGGLLQLQGDGGDVFIVDKTGAVTTGSGVTVGNSSSTTAGTIRWSGTDLEVFDGAIWVSLTSGGGGGGGATASSLNVIKKSDEAVTNSDVLQNDDELTFAVGANETWTYEFYVQARSGTTPDFRFSVDAPVAAVCQFALADQENAISRANQACNTNAAANGNNTDDLHIVAGTVTTGASAGNVTLQWAQNTANAAATTVYAGSYVVARQEAATLGASASYFEQSGNAFGATATLGTTDTFGLDLITDGTVALGIDATGAATLSNGLTIDSGGLNLTGDDITQSGDITGAAGLTLASGGGGDLTLTSASGLVVLNADTLQRTAAGTTTLDLLDAAGATTLRLENSNLGQVANLSVEGGVTAASFNGDGAGLTSLNGTNITSGTVADARLSSNVALLDGTNTFDNNTTFSSGLVVGNTALTTAGNIRFNGTDFEGYDGTSWVSLTSGGSPASPGDYISETIDVNSTASGVLYDVFESANYGAFASTQNAANGIVFTPADGRFTVASDGLYTIDTSLILEASANTLTDIIIRVNGVDVYNHDVFIHSVVDPVERGVAIVQSLTAGDFVEVLVDGAAGNITVNGGTTLTIIPVSSAGGGGGGGGGTSFVQGGNAFGAAAILGTTDATGLSIVTGGTTALSFTAGGDAAFANALTINGGIDLGGDITSTTGLTLASGGGGDLTLTSASGLVVLNADTLQRTAAGTTTLDLLDAAGVTTLSLINSDAGQVANLFVEGDVSAADIISSGTITGDGSGITDLNGTNIVSGTVADARLSSNVALLDADQTFTGINTYSQGVVLGNSISTTAGAVRFNGTDFEGFDGANWVSLNDSGADVVTVIKSTDETISASNTLQDDDELFFEAGANEVWTVDFVVQAQSGTTPDFRFAVNAPFGSTCEIGYENTENAQSVAQYGCGVSTNRVAGNNANDTYRISGTIRTAATPGEIRLQWAQFTSDAGNTIVRSGSYLRAVEENGASGGGGGGGGGLSFEQNGNAFGADANLGTTDTFGLNFYTDGNIAASINALGNTTFNNTVTSNGLLTAGNGITFTSGGLNLGTGGVTNTGSIAGATTINASGAATVGSVSTTGSVSAGSVTSTGAITGATAGDTINGLIINSGSLSGITGLTQTSGNVAISGTGTFSTGTGDISLNGDVTVDTVLGVDDGLSVNGTNANASSRIYAQDTITTGSVLVPGSGISNTYTFDADGDADEAAWTFVSDNGGNGLNPANTARAWSHDTDDTTSGGVGPTSGQGGSPDGYIYTEASGTGAFNDTFHVTYNTILDAATTDWIVDFYWNQRGDDNTGTLDLQTNENGAGWVTRGSYGGGDVASNATQVWNFETLDLTSFVSDASTEVRFLVTFPAAGTTWHNDFALDTITVREASTTPVFTYGDNIIEGYNANTTADVDLLALRSDVGSVGNVVFRVDSEGDVFSDGTNNIAGGADIAEQYLNSDGAQPGDVVYFTDNRTVAKTSEVSQAALAGVVSSDAAVVLDAAVDGVPVALKGRVPTKVSIANGAIRRGDYLTSGPDGRALKATSSGTAIGVAMEHAEADSTIDVFVGLTYYVASTGDSLPAAGLTFIGIEHDDSVAEQEALSTVCISDGCGYLRLATATPTEDQSLQDTIAINKTSEQGNLISLKRNNSPVFSVSNSGSLEIRSSSDGALDIRNTGGEVFFSVNTNTGVTTAADLTVTGSLRGAGLADCSGEYDSLQWNAESGLFSCRQHAPELVQVVDQTGAVEILGQEDSAVAFDSELHRSQGYQYQDEEGAASNSTVSVVQAGLYRIDYAVVSQAAVDDEELAVECAAWVNGIRALTQSKSYSYNLASSPVTEDAATARNQGGVTTQLEAGDRVTLMCSSVGSSQITAQTVAGESWLTIEKR